MGVQPFAQGQGDIAVFASIYEIILKFNHMLLVCQYYGTQEDLGTLCILRAFTEDAVEIARTVIDDVYTLDATYYRLHSALSALLQTYLQTHTAKDWGVMCVAFVWPDVFAHCWMEAVRLHNFLSVIAMLTAWD
jgi:hypothetical protein